MRLAFVSVLGLASLALLAADCVNSATPIAQRCPTTAASVSFYANGSCGKPGIVTLSTMPGLCAIEIQNGISVGLPSSGNFTGDASKTNYQLTQGNWSLLGQSSDPQADPSTEQCAATAAATGEVLVKCSLNECVPSGEDNGFQCTPGSCQEHLGPIEPDAGSGDGGVDAPNGTDGAVSPSDASAEAGDAGASEAGDAGGD